MSAFVIAAKDLRLRLRDRSAIVTAFIAPLGLATIITFAFGGGGAGFHATFAVVDEDGGGLAKTFVDGVLGAPGLKESITLRRIPSSEKARALAAADEVSAAIIIPEGFTAAIRSGQPARIEVVRHVENRISGEIAQALADGFAAEINAVGLSVTTAVAAAPQTNLNPFRIQELIERATGERIPVRVTEGRVGARAVSQASYFGPSMAIFFLFFTVQSGALSILVERREGTLSRLLASPVTPGAVLWGKGISAFALGLLSLTTMAVATTLLLGANWGDPLAVAVLASATVLAAMGITTLVIVSSRTEEQAAGLSAIVAAALALLGGNFIPINLAPPAVQLLALATPHGWAMRGFVDLVASGGGVETILRPIGALLAIAITTGAVAAARARNMVAA